MDSSLVMNQLNTPVSVKEVMADEQQLMQQNHHHHHQYYSQQPQQYALPLVPLPVVVPQALVK